METDYSTNVFINCPYDKDYSSMKHALMFSVKSCGFTPMLVSMNQDSGIPRIIKIKEMISCSKYGIHDISRCKSTTSGEWYRMNMPFEMGLDFGRSYFSEDDRLKKKFLVLTAEPYSHQPSLSDLSGNDPKCYEGDIDKLIGVVRNFLYNMSPPNKKNMVPTSKDIRGHYIDFQSRLYINSGSDKDLFIEMDDDEYCIKIDDFYKRIL